jgi:hypothetical protein
MSGRHLKAISAISAPSGDRLTPERDLFLFFSLLGRLKFVDLPEEIR